MNARSVRNKAANIKDYIVEEAIDLMLITETWLRPDPADNVAIADLKPPGYSVLHEARPSSRAGGVGIVHRDTIKANKASEIKTFKSFEHIHVEAKIKSVAYRLLVVYRPPPSPKNRSTPSDFFVEFDSLLQDVILLKGRLIIVGDINFHLDDVMDPNSIKLTDLLDGYGLHQLVSVPTRGKHTLDVVITHIEEDPVENICVTDPLLSDHKVVTFHLDTQRPPLPQKEIAYRQIGKINLIKLKSDIANDRILNGEYLTSLTECTDCILAFNNAAETLLNSHAPIKRKVITVRPVIDWYTKTVDEARRFKRKWERKWLATGLAIHKQLFAKAKEKLSQSILEAKKDFLSHRILEANNCQKALFKCVDMLLNKPRASPLPDGQNSEDLANQMADFFDGKVVRLRDELAQIQQVTREGGNHDPRATSSILSFPPISQEELRTIILKAPTKSCQLDALPTKLVKECIDQLLPALHHIINTSLTTSTVPEPFKKALVTPLLKKANLDHNILKNYRPVSNLSFLSKILEKVVSKNMTEYKSTYNLHQPLQSAYRSHHSTETALLKVQNDILHAMDDGCCVFLVLLDLSAAFDTVDHSTMISRLHHSFGVSGDVLRWFKSYLKDRNQVVSIHGTVSSSRTLDYGVPQGSVLGPELFKDYITPLPDLINSFHVGFHGYADDTQLYVAFEPGKNETESRKKLENCIAAVKSWMALNWLKLNDDKTEFIIFGTPFQLRKVITTSIRVGEHTIQAVTSVRNIGAIFDKNMKMDVHVNKTTQLAWYHLYNISKIRLYLSKEQTQSVVHAYVTSRLDQNNSLLSGVADMHLEKLQKVQNAAAKVILGGKKRDHVTGLLKTLHWLPVRKRKLFKILLLIFKTINGQGPKYLKELLLPYVPPRTLRSASHHHLVVPNSTYVTLGDRAFGKVGPTEWNSLPLRIRSSENTVTFKSRLKKYLFDKHYNIRSSP